MPSTSIGGKSSLAEGKMEIDAVKDKRSVEEIHSYACPSNERDECTSSPSSLLKHRAKEARDEKNKGKQNEEEEPTLIELQEAIISTVTTKINARADQTDKAVQFNTIQIEHLKKSLEFCHQEVMDLKHQNTALKDQCSILKQKAEELEKKMDEADRYSRRLNLRRP
ncbi:hypothetical protein ILYODFUR_035961 [Ilyodon furcidens]|uniref:Uncharacterized protein n=1 Tax=Ilyodon furcidens TaxID=33524 RepID=A0ABV0SV12_9TELE